MYQIILHTSDGQTGIVILGFDDEEVETWATGSSMAYYHLRLSEYFPDAEDLLREHILLINATGGEDEDALNRIIEDDLGIDRAIESVEVSVLTADTIGHLQANPTGSHVPRFPEHLPVIIFVLGGQEGVERWVANNLERA